MRIFVAGAIDAVDAPTVARLLSERHEVFCMTRSKERVEALGAIPVVTDALDESGVMQGVNSARPEVVIDMLTALPKVYTPEAMRAAHRRRISAQGSQGRRSSALYDPIERFLVCPRGGSCH